MDSALPDLRCDIVVGPAEFIAGAACHYVHRRGSGRYFRVGEREAFLLRALAGNSPPENVRSAFQRRFGRALHDADLNAAIELFVARGLLHGEATSPDEPAPRGREGGAVRSVGYKFVQWNPASWLHGAARHAGWLCESRVMAVWAAGLLCCELFALAHFHAIWHQISTAPADTWPARVGTLLLLMGLMAVPHEAAHAIACCRFGAEVREMGMMLRSFVPSAYTRLDAAQMLQSRWQRVRILLLGPLVSLSVLPLAASMWYALPPSSAASLISADILVVYNASCLLQLLPLLHTDGYFILTTLLRMPELRSDAAAWLLRRALGAHHRPPPARFRPGVPRYLELACAAYGLFEFVFLPAAVAILLLRCASAARTVPGASIAFAASVAIVVAGFFRLRTHGGSSRSMAPERRRAMTPYRPVIRHGPRGAHGRQA